MLMDKKFLMPILLFISLTCISQRYSMQKYTEMSGLSNSAVFGVAQDTLGQMWFATRKGISQYNGLFWKNFGHAEGLQADAYSIIECDKKGRLWAMPAYGEPNLSLFNGENWALLTPWISSNSKSKNNFLEIFYDTDDKMSALSAGGESGFKLFTGQKWKKYQLNSGKNNDKVTGTAQIGDSIFISSRNGLHLFHQQELQLNVGQQYNIPKDIVGIHIQKSHKGFKLWLVGRHWLGYLENNKFHLIDNNLDLIVDNEIYFYANFLADGDNGIYIYNPFFVAYYSIEKSLIQSLGEKNGLVTEGATQLLFDRENNLWITTFRGVNKISSKAFSYYTEVDGLFENEVTSIEERSPGNLIIGHHGALSFFNNGKIEKYVLEHPLIKESIEKRVQDLVLDRKGNIWIAASKLGLGRLSPNNKLEWKYTLEDPNAYLVSVVEDPTGEIYFASNMALYKIKNGKGILLEGCPFNITSIRKLFIAKDSAILATMHSGSLLRYKDGNWSQIKSHNPDNSNNTYSYLCDSKGQEWLGNNDGVFIFKNGEPVRPENKELHINRPVYFIFEDAAHNYWFGTDNGLYKYNGTTINHYNVKDGLYGQELNRDAVYQDQDANLWFGTNSGLSVYHKEFERNQNTCPVPLVFLTDLEVGKDTIPLQKSTSLDFDQNTLFFHYLVSSFIDENENFVRWKLEGFDKEWSSEYKVSNNMVRYINLPPGAYRFCIQAKNAIGIWSKEVCSGEITINKPYYLRWDFRIAALLFLGVLIYLITRFIINKRYTYALKKQVAHRTQQLKRNEVKLKKINNTKDQFFSIIAHDLRSPFNSILGLTEYLDSNLDELNNQEKRQVTANLLRSSRNAFELLEDLLTWARSQEGKIPFDPSYFDLNELVKENLELMGSSAMEKQITLTPGPNESRMVWADYNMINTVIRNLLNNAIKFTPQKGTISISSQDREKDVLICVQDNGIGIPNELKVKLFDIDGKTGRNGTAGEKGTGLGLTLCRDFVELHHGKIWVGEQTKKGSTFCFTIPKTADHTNKIGNESIEI
jgi:signal transduction histidine kinase/ligand-binding sensor domain-containing protein